VSLSGNRIGRGRLLVVRAPRGPAPTPARVALFLRAVLVRIRIFWLDLVALAGASVALAPLLFRRRSLRHRTQVPRPAAQVIALQPRRRAAPP
jgi:hypothetical protein